MRTKPDIIKLVKKLCICPEAASVQSATFAHHRRSSGTAWPPPASECPHRYQTEIPSGSSSRCPTWHPVRHVGTSHVSYWPPIFSFSVNSLIVISFSSSSARAFIVQAPRKIGVGTLLRRNIEVNTEMTSRAIYPLHIAGQTGAARLTVRTKRLEMETLV